MGENIILKKSPKVEFQLLDNGFNLIDGQTERNSGFYSYHDVQSVELNKGWFPRLAIWLRVITSLINFVPFFPDADSYKKANLVIHLRKTKLGIWLTDPHMADEAKRLGELLNEKTKLNHK